MSETFTVIDNKDGLPVSIYPFNLKSDAIRMIRVMPKPSDFRVISDKTGKTVWLKKGGKK